MKPIEAHDLNNCPPAHPDPLDVWVVLMWNPSSRQWNTMGAHALAKDAEQAAASLTSLGYTCKIAHVAEGD